MRYLKTIDGRIIDTDRYLIGKRAGDSFLTFYDNRKVMDFELPISEMGEESDTIEKLCDGYHVINGIASFSSGDIYDSLKDAKDFADDLNSYCDRKGINYKGRIVLYAFVATEKGLIYVAKMNEKGEFELL